MPPDQPEIELEKIKYFWYLWYIFRPIEGRNMALERMARSLYGLPEVEPEEDITAPK